MLNALTVSNSHPDLTDFYVARLLRSYVYRLAGERFSIEPSPDMVTIDNELHSNGPLI